MHGDWWKPHCNVYLLIIVCICQATAARNGWWGHQIDKGTDKNSEPVCSRGCLLSMPLEATVLKTNKGKVGRSNGEREKQKMIIAQIGGQTSITPTLAFCWFLPWLCSDF